ncbi:MAG: hypothetical protein V1897_13825 [Pseudomonadota bacterium]
MEGNLTMQQDLGNKGEAPASIPEPVGVALQPPVNPSGGMREAVDVVDRERCDSCYDEIVTGEHAGPAGAMEGAQRQPPSQDWTRYGDTCSKNADSQINCENPNGFQASQETHGFWNPGSGQRQAGPIPSPDPYFGHYMGDPGLHGSFASHQPMGGPHPWTHPGPGYHPGYFTHHPGTYGHPTGGPYFANDGGAGFVGGATPRHHCHTEDNSGQLADMVGKALQGQATPQDLINGLLNLNFRDDQFWKGIVIGSVAALLFNSESVRNALLGTLGGLFGAFQDKAQGAEQPDGKKP